MVADLRNVFTVNAVEDGRPIILSILSRATYRQRILIKELYYTLYNQVYILYASWFNYVIVQYLFVLQDICDQLQKFLPTREAQLILQLFLHPASIDAYYLKQALGNFSLDEQYLILFLGHRYVSELSLMSDSYETSKRKISSCYFNDYCWHFYLGDI